MRTIDSGVRTAYLSSQVTPQSRISVRKNRCDFGGAPLVWNTNQVPDHSYASDDTLGRFVWGDSCVNDTYLARLVSATAAGETPHTYSDFLASITATPGTAGNWAYIEIADNSIKLKPYCRLGLYPRDVTSSYVRFYVWVVNDSDDLTRRELDYTKSGGTWAWGASSTAKDVGSPGVASCAVHPVSATEAIIIGYAAPYVWCQYVAYDGSWTSGSVHVLWNADSLTFSDCQLSDAVAMADGKIAILVNLSGHGSVHSVIYNPDGDQYSAPRLVLGGGVDDMGYRVLVTGLSLINGRLWGVTQRSIEGSDETPYAFHTALISSPDGINWKDDDFVGPHTCYGKVLYSSTGIYVAGNAMVYESLRPNKLGYDHASLKREYVSTISGWEMDFPGAGSAATLSASGIGDDLSLLDPEAEVILEMGSGGTYSTISTMTLAIPSRSLRYAFDAFSLQARGPTYWLDGDGAYQPPVAKIYESADSFKTTFNSDTGNPKISVRQSEGEWGTEKDPDTGIYTLRGERGLALVPRILSTQYLQIKTHFKMKISVTGTYIVFWHEDDDNYWRAGLYYDLDTVTNKLVIQRVASGVATTIGSTPVTAFLDTWYSLLVEVRPGRIRVWWKNSESNDFSSSTASLDETIGVGAPFPYHVGLQCLAFRGVSDASIYGTVDKAYSKWLQDYDADFPATVVGQWVYVPQGDQWRQIVDYTALVEAGTGDYYCLTVSPDFASVPAYGNEYGIFPEKGQPNAYFRDLTFSTMAPVWTVDDIVDDVLEMAGPGRDTSVYSATIPTTSTSSTIHTNLDLSWATPSSSPTIVFYASNQNTSTFRGWELRIEASYTKLYYHDSGGYTLKYAVPNFVTISTWADHTFRVVVYQDTVIVHVDNYPLASFAEVGGTNRGYCWRSSSGGTVTIREFPQMKESFLWDSESPNSVLARLLQGLRAKLIEKADGTLAVSRLDTKDDLGTWSTTLIGRQSGAGPVPSILSLAGAEIYAHYLDTTSARLAIRFRKADNPTLETEREVLAEAYRLAKYAREVAEQTTVSLHVPDPACEVEDQVTVNSTDWIVSACKWSFQVGENDVSFVMDARLRKIIDDPDVGVWATDSWGQFYYG